MLTGQGRTSGEESAACLRTPLVGAGGAGAFWRFPIAQSIIRVRLRILHGALWNLCISLNRTSLELFKCINAIKCPLFVRLISEEISL